MSLNFYLGASNYFKILDFNKNAIFKSFGFFPEFRILFNPVLPKKITYEQDGELFSKKGEYEIQVSYGYGGGIFLKTNSGLIALKIELNTNDPFSVLRDLEYGKRIICVQFNF